MPTFKIVQRPIIPIEIKGHLFFALLDSGADHTVMSKEFAEAMDIKEGDETELHTFRDIIRAYKGKLNLTIKDPRGREDIKLSHVTCLICDEEKKYEEEANLVIRIAGVFDKCKITFDLANKKLKIHKHTDLTTRSI